ncbi:hypothetical protein Bbelb_386010 [Branchiostoma belcheri]|nr:hypothetical protein Bbelb_386010 [Branchiostoma belcheri]
MEEGGKSTQNGSSDYKAPVPKTPEETMKNLVDATTYLVRVVDGCFTGIERLGERLATLEGGAEGSHTVRRALWQTEKKSMWKVDNSRGNQHAGSNNKKDFKITGQIGELSFSSITFQIKSVLRQGTPPDSDVYLPAFVPKYSRIVTEPGGGRCPGVMGICIITFDQQVQYHAGRLVSGAMARTPHGKLLEELEWDSLATRRYFNRLLIMYKLVSGSVPSHLQLLIPTTRDSRRQLNLRLRNDTHLHVPYCRTNTYGSSFVPYTTRLWNNLPKEVKEATSLLQFKQRCRAHMLSSRHHQGYRRLGDRRSNILATRLRIGWCQLNSTLAKFNLTGRGCACGATSETVTHFLLRCPLHAAARQDLATAVYRLVRRPLSTSVLLNRSPGNDITLNNSLSHSFHTYITSTNRF